MHILGRVARMLLTMHCRRVTFLAHTNNFRFLGGMRCWLYHVNNDGTIDCRRRVLSYFQHYKTTHSKLYICKFWAAESTVLVALGWIIHAAVSSAMGAVECAQRYSLLRLFLTSKNALTPKSSENTREKRYLRR